MRADVLVVEDYQKTRDAICGDLESHGYRVRSAASGRDAYDQICDQRPDIVVSDYRMNPINGLELLQRIRNTMDVPFILYSAGADTDAIFQAGQSGAMVFLEYPFKVKEQLIPTIEDAIQKWNPKTVDYRNGVHRISGKSEAAHWIRSSILKAANSQSNVLVVGEPGIGKNWIIDAMVEMIPDLRRKTVIFEWTAESHFDDSRVTQLEGGILFVDEVGDLSPALQAQLVQCVSDTRFRPVEVRTGRGVPIRVFSTSHRNIEKQVASGALREDLYYKIAQARISLIPIRDRFDDLEQLIPELFHRISNELRVTCPEIDPDFIPALKQYHWPGNIGELHSLLREMMVWWDGKSVMGEIAFSEAFSRQNPQFDSTDLCLRSRMIDAYYRFQENQEAARRALGISRSEWRSRWNQYGLDIIKRNRRGYNVRN